MSTQFTNRQWRLPNNENKAKQSNYSMDFDGVNDYIDCGSFSDYDNGDLSVSMWIKKSTMGTYEYALSNSGSSAKAGFDIVFENSFRRVSIGRRTRTSDVSTGFADIGFTLNTWHNIAFTYQDSTRTLKVYMDSVLQSTTIGSASTNSASLNLTIGSYQGTSNFASGKIDAVSIFNYELSSSQVTTLYGSSSTGIGNPMSLSPKPVAYYPLGDQDAFNGANYLVPNSSLKDYVFYFESLNDVVSFGDVDLGPNNFTFSFWFKHIDEDNTYGLVAGKTGVLTVYNYKTQNRFFGYVYNDSGGSVYFDTGDLTNENFHNWTLISIVYDGSNVSLYVNGVSSITPVSFTGLIPNNSNNLELKGKSNSQNWQLSNISLFDTNLPATGTESITSLYNYGTPPNIASYSNLQGWWKLDASATYDSSTTTWTIPDDSSNSNDGTSSGMTQANLVQSDLSFTSGYSPFALDFDSASSDYIDCGTGLGDSLGTYTGDLTLSYWFNTNSLTANDGIFTIGNFNNTQGEFQVNIYNNNMLFRVDSGNQRKTLSISSLSTGTWYHIGFIYKSGDISNSKVYLNGAEQSTTDLGTFPSSLSFSGLKTILGGYYGTGNTFDGSISNCSIWNAALTSSQVTEIYNEGVPSNLNNHSAYSNLVSWWQLGSNTSWVDPYWIALDEKGTNNGQSQNVAAPNNMGENAIVDGVGSYANGLSNGMGGDEVIGDAPYSSSNSLSVNMDVEDRTTDTPS